MTRGLDHLRVNRPLNLSTVRPPSSGHFHLENTPMSGIKTLANSEWDRMAVAILNARDELTESPGED